MSTAPDPRPRPAARPTAAPAARPAAAAQPAQPAQPQQAQPQQAEAPMEDAATSDQKFVLTYGLPSGGVSFLFNLVMILILAFIVTPGAKETQTVSAISEQIGPDEEVVEIQEQKIEPLNVNAEASDAPVDALPDAVPADVTEPSPAEDLDSAPIAVELNPLGESTAPKNDMMREIGAFTGTGLEGRGEKARAANVGKYGGSKGSEAAVAAALKWFAEHQLPDGSWSYDHRGGKCQGRCRNQGGLADAKIGATAQALLPFLGAGQTHMEGAYKNNVKAGLGFLLRSMKVEGGQRGDLMEGGGSMYSHGLASIVLCEAYAMTHDKGLMQPAQLAINHIVFAQDPIGGGWRYAVKQPGDTSVVGWQLMALKSGHMAYLNVPPQTIKMASAFLDSVQAEYGSQYGYTGPAAGHDATTAIGLLCRMYLGWKQDHPGLVAGVKFLSGRGPSPSNMYYNYYATQVMRHQEGEEWKKWNGVMRDQLVNSQAKGGHEEGSWFMGGGDHGADRGGRLYCTSMATMILEVYYRHMPIYQKNAAKDEFKL